MSLQCIQIPIHCILTWGNAVEVSLMIIPGSVGYKITSAANSCTPPPNKK